MVFNQAGQTVGVQVNASPEGNTSRSLRFFVASLQAYPSATVAIVAIDEADASRMLEEHLASEWKKQATYGPRRQPALGFNVGDWSIQHIPAERRLTVIDGF